MLLHEPLMEIRFILQHTVISLKEDRHSTNTEEFLSLSLGEESYTLILILKA